MLVNADYHSTAGCDHADVDDLTLNAKKLYLMISVMLHASKRDIKFSWMEYGPMGRMVMPPLAIWAGAATMMPHTTQTLEETCIAAGQHISGDTAVSRKCSVYAAISARWHALEQQRQL